MRLDDCLSNESGSKEGPEWDEKVSTSYTSKVKQWIGNL